MEDYLELIIRHIASSTQQNAVIEREKKLLPFFIRSYFKMLGFEVIYQWKSLIKRSSTATILKHFLYTLLIHILLAIESSVEIGYYACEITFNSNLSL